MIAHEATEAGEEQHHDRLHDRARIEHQRPDRQVIAALRHSVNKSLGMARGLQSAGIKTGNARAGVDQLLSAAQDRLLERNCRTAS